MLQLVPISLKEANEFIKQHHRHHGPKTNGYRIAVAVSDGEKIVGVALAGNPAGRALCDGLTLEVSRTCTDGSKNANSMLYGAIWRAAKALGWKKLITYTMPEESGASLKAVGWVCEGEYGGVSWNMPNRKRADKHPVGKKLRWVKEG